MTLTFLSSFPFLKKSSKKKQMEQDQSRQALKKDLEQKEKDYIEKHNACAKKIGERNDAERDLFVKGINVGTKSEVERVGLHVVQSNDTVKEAIGNTLEKQGLSAELGQGFFRGFANKKAEQQGLSPERYDKPTGKNYIVTGAQTLGMTPNVAKTVHHQNHVVSSFLHFGKAKNDLKEARMANLIDQHGKHLVYKNGRIVSGSLQASSPEELAKMLGETEPASNIKPSDVKLPLPNAKHLLPPLAPEKLPITPTQEEIQKAEKAVKNLSPKERTEKSLAEREQRIAKLEADLRKEDLQKAVAERDCAQVNIGVDLAKVAVRHPKDSAEVGVNYLWKQGTKSDEELKSLQQASAAVGQSLGEQLGDGHAEEMIKAQANLEAIHAKGQPIAKELVELNKNKVMEDDRHRTIDEETGEKFYDPYESTKEMDSAEKRYEEEAVERLRPEDRLYLNNKLTQFVPDMQEGWRRVKQTIAKPNDEQLTLSNAKHLLPPEVPEKLPDTSNPNKLPEKAVKILTLKERTEKELAEREQQIANLEADLRKEDPVALKEAIAKRDCAQVKTGADVAQVVIQHPGESFILAENYLFGNAELNKASKELQIGDDVVKQASATIGQSLIEQLGEGHAAEVIKAQAEVETRHAKGQPIAEKLIGHYKEKAMEEDLHMTVDEETGEKFYDTYRSTRQASDAKQRYEQEAVEKLPRPEDVLYLNDEVPKFVPGANEGLRRVLMYDNENTRFIPRVKEAYTKFEEYGRSTLKANMDRFLALKQSFSDYSSFDHTLSSR